MLETYSRQRYPRSFQLRDGTELKVRPLTPEDRDLLVRFFEQIPADDLIHLDRNPRSAQVIQEWLEGIERGEMIHLVAENADGDIVAHCLVYQTMRGWKGHQGRIRVVTRPDYRRKGMASRMINEMIQLCLNSGLDLLIAEFMVEQTNAMETFYQNGFHRIALIPSYVRDLKGRDRDLVLMALNIREQEYFAGD